MVLLELQKLQDLEHAPIAPNEADVATRPKMVENTQVLKLSGPIADKISEMLLKEFPHREDKDVATEGMVASQLEIAEKMLEDDRNPADDVEDLYVFVVNHRNVTPAVVQEIEETVLREAGKSERALMLAYEKGRAPQNVDLFIEAAARLRAKVLVTEGALVRWLSRGRK